MSTNDQHLRNLLKTSADLASKLAEVNRQIAEHLGADAAPPGAPRPYQQQQALQPQAQEKPPQPPKP